jgi:large subunit ribosomal protein L18
MKSIRKRRLERKTDYKSRLALLKSQKPRLVIRKTNRYLIAQIVQSEIAQDKTSLISNSKDLLQKGWPKEHSGSLKSLPAAYLTGFIMGKAALSNFKDKEIILDLGMHRSIPKARLFAVLKGALDAGLKISHDSEILPTIEQLKSNEKLAPLIDQIRINKSPPTKENLEKN